MNNICGVNILFGTAEPLRVVNNNRGVDMISLRGAYKVNFPSFRCSDVSNYMRILKLKSGLINTLCF